MSGTHPKPTMNPNLFIRHFPSLAMLAGLGISTANTSSTDGTVGTIESFSLTISAANANADANGRDIYGVGD